MEPPAVFVCDVPNESSKLNDHQFINEKQNRTEQTRHPILKLNALLFNLALPLVSWISSNTLCLFHGCSPKLFAAVSDQLFSSASTPTAAPNSDTPVELADGISLW